MSKAVLDFLEFILTEKYLLNIFEVYFGERGDFIVFQGDLSQIIKIAQ